MRKQIIFFALAACASPSIEFPRDPAGIVEFENRKYSVFRNGTRIQVIRTGYMRGSEFERVLPEMIASIREVTGCVVSVDSLVGDVAVRTGDIKC